MAITLRPKDQPEQGDDMQAKLRQAWQDGHDTRRLDYVVEIDGYGPVSEYHVYLGPPADNPYDA